MYIDAKGPWGLMTLILHAVGLATVLTLTLMMFAQRVETRSVDFPILFSAAMANISQIIYVGTRTTELCQAISLIGSLAVAAYLGIATAMLTWYRKYARIQYAQTLISAHVRLPPIRQLLLHMAIFAMICIVVTAVMYARRVSAVLNLVDGVIYDQCSDTTDGDILVAAFAGFVILIGILSVSMGALRSPVTAASAYFWSLLHVSVVSACLIVVMYALQDFFYYQFGIGTILVFIAATGAVLINFIDRPPVFVKEIIMHHGATTEMSMKRLNVNAAARELAFNLAPKANDVMLFADVSVISRLDTEKHWNKTKLMILRDQLLIFNENMCQGAQVDINFINRVDIEPDKRKEKLEKNADRSIVYGVIAPYGATLVQIGFKTVEMRNSVLRACQNACKKPTSSAVTGQNRRKDKQRFDDIYTITSSGAYYRASDPTVVDDPTKVDMVPTTYRD